MIISKGVEAAYHQPVSYGYHLENGFRMSIAAPAWIQRANRLPEPNQRVLVYAPASWQDITVATYKPDNKGAKHMFVRPDHQGVDRYIKGVTHWMPLPEAPLIDQQLSG